METLRETQMHRIKIQKQSREREGDADLNAQSEKIEPEVEVDHKFDSCVNFSRYLCPILYLLKKRKDAELF